MGGCCFWFATVAVVAVAPACSSLSGLTPPFPDWCAALERWPLLHRHLYRVVGCDPASGSAAAARLPECGASLESWKAAAVGVATVGGRRVAGLPAAQAAGYASLANGSFRCLDGQGAVPAAAVNDDFCDCADGSDEPGTSACAHLPRRCFYCPNEGAAPRVIYASRVGDGICDCCDGSDEAAGGPRAPCPDTCEEEGAAAREERARREADAVAGLRFLAESRAGAGERVAAWRREAAEIAATLPQLEQAEKDAKQRRDDLQKEVDAHRAAAEAARKAEAEAEAARRAEAEAEVEAARPAEAEAAAEAAAPAGPAAGAPPAAEAEAAPAEPAAGAAAAPRGGGAAGEAPVVSEYAKWALDRESKDAPDRGPASDSDADGPSTGTAGTGEDASTPQAERDLEDAKSAYLAASAKAKQARADKQELDKNAKLDFGDDFRWISLVGACPEKPLGEYTYKVCFFGEARQDRTLLGRYAGWDASDPMVMTFAKGSSCPGGTLRALRVRLECAASQELLSVTEPDRCSYEARLGHPAACTQEGLGLLQAPAGSSVRMPRDEL